MSKNKKLLLMALMLVLVFPLFTVKSTQAAPQCFIQGAGGTRSPYNGPCSDGQGGYIQEDSNNCYFVTQFGATPINCETNQTTPVAKCFYVRTSGVTGNDGVTVFGFEQVQGKNCAELAATFPGINPLKDTCYVIGGGATGVGAVETSCANIVAEEGKYQNVLTQQNIDEKIDSDFENASREEALNNCQTANEECFDKNPIVVMLKFAINFFAGAVGVIVTIVIILAGIQYSSAGGDPGKAASAKKHIYNAIIALIAFIFLWAFMQWLIPGGVL